MPTAEHHVSLTFHEVDGREICRVDVIPSTEPVFVKFEPKKLYVRDGNGNVPLEGRALVEYVQKHFRR